MAVTSKILRAESARLRELGWTYRRIALELRHRHRINARAAYRLAHGWTQEEAARQWNERWPHEGAPKTGKAISYWEIWPARGGRAPSAATLARLAELYHCRPGDLLDGPDHGETDGVADTWAARRPRPVPRRGLIRYRREDHGVFDTDSDSDSDTDTADPAAAAAAATARPRDRAGAAGSAGSPVGGDGPAPPPCDGACDDPYCRRCLGGIDQITGWVSAPRPVMVHQAGPGALPCGGRAA